MSSAADIKRDMKLTQPGDELVMANGTWQDQFIIFEGNGTETNPITLKAQTAGQVILTGTSHLEIRGNYLHVEGLYFKDGDFEEYTDKSSVINIGTSDVASSHCHLTNTVIDNYNSSDNTNRNKWIRIYGAYNEVDHCSFTNKKNKDVLLEIRIENTHPNYHHIHHNYFADRPDPEVHQRKEMVMKLYGLRIAKDQNYPHSHS